MVLCASELPKCAEVYGIPFLPISLMLPNEVALCNICPSYARPSVVAEVWARVPRGH